MLSKPVLARCDNRAKLARTNPTYGEPEQWMTSANLALLGLSAISFDYFVDWNDNPPRVQDELWVKRVSREPVDHLTPEQVLRGCQACGDDLKALEGFARAYGFKARVVAFRDKVDWQRAPEPLLFSTLEQGTFDEAKPLSLQDAQDLIRRLSGGPVRIGEKGLMYGTSSLECYLSRTDALWPGDADSVLVNSDFNRAIALLEFKKHNLDTPLEHENIQKYMRIDARKWRRLGLLRDRIEAPLFCVYYSTNPLVNQIKVERLVGPFNALRDGGSRMIKIAGMTPRDIGSAIAEHALGNTP